jgi:hypothetical protein
MPVSACPNGRGQSYLCGKNPVGCYLETTPNQLKLFIDELAFGTELQVEGTNSPLDELVPGGQLRGAELIETTPVCHVVSKQN